MAPRRERESPFSNCGSWSRLIFFSPSFASLSFLEGITLHPSGYLCEPGGNCAKVLTQLWEQIAESVLLLQNPQGDASCPTPQGPSFLISVIAVGLNFWTLLLLGRHYRPPPCLPKKNFSNCRWKMADTLYLRTSSDAGTKLLLQNKYSCHL